MFIEAVHPPIHEIYATACGINNLSEQKTLQFLAPEDPSLQITLAFVRKTGYYFLHED
jgi:hypothetical protein